MECVQTDNGFEFTNRFSNSKRDFPTLFETIASQLGIRHKLIRPYTPRHNGKVERSHREDSRSASIPAIVFTPWMTSPGSSLSTTAALTASL